MDFSILFMIFTIVIIVLSNGFMESQAYTEITYNKSENDLYFSSNFILLSNGNILFRFYRPIDDKCYEPNLHLKLFNKNGTLTNFDVENFSVSKLNFCKSRTSYPSYPTDNIIIMFLFERLYILYYNISENDVTAPFGMKALTINLEGKILR